MKGKRILVICLYFSALSTIYTQEMELEYIVDKQGEPKKIECEYSKIYFQELEDNQFLKFTLQDKYIELNAFIDIKKLLLHEKSKSASGSENGGGVNHSWDNVATQAAELFEMADSETQDTTPSNQRELYDFLINDSKQLAQDLNNEDLLKMAILASYLLSNSSDETLEIVKEQINDEIPIIDFSIPQVDFLDYYSQFNLKDAELNRSIEGYKIQMEME